MKKFTFRPSSLCQLAVSALTAGTLAIGGLAVSTAIDPCRNEAWANHPHAKQSTTRSRFGRDARHGRNGRDGDNGRSGPDRVITIYGDPVRLDLSGNDGENGSRADSADSPQCRRQPRNVHGHQRAANGGNGGDGGDGGRGGDGGDLTIYVEEKNHLQQLLVDNSGGSGGRGGRGAGGTNGCRCEDQRWTVNICNIAFCRDETYTCTDGTNGADGDDGADGRNGDFGGLSIVPQLDGLPTENRGLSRPIRDLVGQKVTLSRNLWDLRSGARGLLASGSNIDDDYYFYTGHAEKQFLLSWQAPQQANDFTDSVALEMNDKGNIEMRFPEAYWLLGSTIEQDMLTTYQVEGIVPVREVTRLAMGRVQGRSRTFEINVVDQAQLSNDVDTRFELVYSTSNDDRPRNRYHVQYEGPVSPDLVQQDRNRFTLALGRLPLSSQLLRGGTDARVQLKIIRSYGNSSAEQTLTWTGRI